MKLSKARLISAIIFAIMGIALVVGVCLTWYNQGCGWDSLIAAIAVFGCGSIGLGVCSDEFIKDYFKHKDIDKYEYR